jgi:hypothetical protein
MTNCAMKKHSIILMSITILLPKKKVAQPNRTEVLTRPVVSAEQEEIQAQSCKAVRRPCRRSDVAHDLDLCPRPRDEVQLMEIPQHFCTSQQRLMSATVHADVNRDHESRMAGENDASFDFVRFVCWPARVSWCNCCLE